MLFNCVIELRKHFQVIFFCRLSGRNPLVVLQLFLWGNSPSKARSVLLTEIVMGKALVEQEFSVTAAVPDLRTISFSQGRDGEKILILQNTCNPKLEVVPAKLPSPATWQGQSALPSIS